MRKNNKKCIVCGKVYTFCNRCSAYDKYPRWMNIYHDENCKNVFDIASDYLHGLITKEEAKVRFDKCDLSNKENFHKAILDAINQVYEGESKSNKKSVKQVVESKVDEKQTNAVNKATSNTEK